MIPAPSSIKEQYWGNPHHMPGNWAPYVNPNRAPNHNRPPQNHKFQKNNFNSSYHNKPRENNLTNYNNPQNGAINNGNVPAYSCKVCDRDFFSKAKYEQHLREHRTCGIDGCTFTAHEKVVEEHICNQHITGLYDRIKNVSTKDDIEKWREERKRNHACNKIGVEKKQKLQEEMDKRGERIQKNENRFGRDNYRLSLQNQNKRHNGKYNNKNNIGMNRHRNNFGRHNNQNNVGGPPMNHQHKNNSFKERHNDDSAQNSNEKAADPQNNGEELPVLKQECNLESKFKNEVENGKNNDEKGRQTFCGRNSRGVSRFMPKEAIEIDQSECNGGIFPFRGTKQLYATAVEEHSTNNPIDDSGWMDDIKPSPKPEERPNNALTLLIGTYGSSEESEQEDVEPEPTVRTSNSVEITCKSPNELSEISPVQTLLESHERKDGNVTSEERAGTASVELNNGKLANKSNMDVVDDGPLEQKIIRENPFELAPPTSNVRDNGESTQTGFQKRKRSHAKGSKDDSTQNTERVYYKKRRVTLLERLLEKDIRHERNLLLQCVRHIVQNNFFDKKT